MVESALKEKLRSAGGRIGEYLGVETVLSFGDPEGEFRQLRQGCGLYDLGWRAKILVTGNDRVRWMNGMVTNNIRDLPLNRGNYNFLLNAQGRIQADMYVYNRGDHLVVDTARWQVPKVLALFDKFIIMDEVEVSDASERVTGLAVQGPGARQALAAAGLWAGELEPLEIRDAGWNGAGYSITRMASDAAETFELWIAPEHAGRVWDALLATGVEPVGTNALEMFRVWAGIPRYGQDIRERDLPQETEQSQALSFNKGCYVGQEIVERIHSRGQVHRGLRGFMIRGATPAPGSKLRAGDKEVGEITSALELPVNGSKTVVALGYLRREAESGAVALEVEGSQALLRKLPFGDLQIE